ncbi:scavenger receptor cysteine-rich type 1 protein M130-like [Halichondria panicea]|uniref:scavenger receptor cysteine-rich type 1 protein M130-like n=1 Tax=Halichondria panicea TaxID=6063 RepID=UPI00312B8216
MRVLSTLLLSIVTIVSTQQQQECLNGQLQQTISNILEYCYHGEWRWICLQDSQWNHERTIFVCTQLGYSGSVRANGPCGTTQRKVVTLTNCSEPGQHLTECMVTASDNCITCFYLSSTCFPAVCTDGEIRLVDGSTDREGRVEVCANRRWRTVCTGSQELAGAVCSQMGYIYFEGGTVAVTNSFPPGAFPEYRLDCTQLSNGTWHCSPVEEQCDSFVELGVVCKNYEDRCSECSRTSTLSTNMQITTQLPTSLQEMYSTTNNNGSSTSLLAVIAVLVVLQVATMIGLISTCVVFKRKHKQKVTMATQQADLTYSVVGGTQTEIKIDPNIAANPAYQAVKCDQEDHTYDVISEGVASRQRRGN